MPADQHVNLRVFEHVADVNRAGDIGRRKRYRKRSAVAGVFGAEKFFVEPGLGPALFDFLRFISLGNFAGDGSGHGFSAEAEQPL